MADADGLYFPVVYQAQGMVAMQAECSVERAFVFIQEMAEKTQTPLEAIAEDVVARRLTFHPRP
jgi:AmiR/NasT family two-component response regulator